MYGVSAPRRFATTNSANAWTAMAARHATSARSIVRAAMSATPAALSNRNVHPIAADDVHGRNEGDRHDADDEVPNELRQRLRTPPQHHRREGGQRRTNPDRPRQ